MSVALDVAPNCTLATAPLAFAASSSGEAAGQNAAAAIEVACGPGVAFTLALDDGQHGSGGERQVRDPATGRTVEYDIFRDAGHTQRWGMARAETVSSTTGADGVARLTAYGALARSNEVTAGRYADVVTVTASF